MHKFPSLGQVALDLPPFEEAKTLIKLGRVSRGTWQLLAVHAGIEVFDKATEAGQEEIRRWLPVARARQLQLLRANRSQ